MKVKAFIERDGREVSVEVKTDAKVRDLIKALSLNPVTVIPAVDGEVVTEEHELKNNDQIKFLSVVSGG